MACVFKPSSEISCLPENLTLDIFKQLPVKDLCTVGRVCKKWRRIISDNTLWRHVDLRPYKLNLPKMWKVIRAHFSDVLLSLHLRGYMDPTGINWKKHSLSDAMLRELNQRCPNIEELELIQANLSNVCCTGLPPQLISLTLQDSFIPPGWFEKVSECPCRLTITCLDLSQSVKTSQVDIKDISCLKSLTHLKLNKCYRVNQHGIVMISESFPDLEQLEIAGTQCTDVALHRISRNLGKLTRLNLSDCRSITDAGLGDVGACLKKLEWLHLQGCLTITDQGIFNLFGLKVLRECDVTGTKATEDGVEKLRSALVKCNVILNQQGNAS